MKKPQGPHYLDQLDEFITEVTPGAYVLVDGFHFVKHVGRADKDLVTKIKKSAKEGDYEYFGYRKTEDDAEAYNIECEWYHHYKLFDKKPHPIAPKGQVLKCPVCGC